MPPTEASFPRRNDPSSGPRGQLDGYSSGVLTTAQEPVEVAVGVIRDDRGRVLVQRRPEHLEQAGRWEFPGGKVEPGESAARALQRELREELGLDSMPGASLIDIPWDYGQSGQRVLLRASTVRLWSGQPQPLDGQELAWVEVDDLPMLDCLAANRPIIRALQLPDYYLITPDNPSDQQAWLERISAAFVDPGIRLVQLRRHDLDDDSYVRLAGELYARCQEHGVRMLVNRDLPVAAQIAADGVHLSAARLAERGIEARVQRCRGWVGASCHSLAELQRAAAVGADFAVLAPVRCTPSHPDRQPLGWGGFAGLTAPAQLPVYALGGLAAADRHTARGHGAQGVAAIRGLLPTA